MKYTHVIWLLLSTCFIVPALSQNTLSLRGSIKSTQNVTLSGATILLDSGKLATISNDEGEYLLNAIPKGKHTIEVQFLGFSTYKDTLILNSNKSLNIVLSPMLQSLQEVIVSDNYTELRNKEDSRSIEVVDKNYLNMNRSGSLMQTLERLPGVGALDIGSGQSKPVIRGLAFNRVVVTENGVKHAGQEWGIDHGLEIDQYSADRIEVIKGPASLMEGSDAIGGVISIKQLNVPPEHSVGGNLQLAGKSNNQSYGGSANVYGRKQHLFYTLRYTGSSYGDFYVPTSSVNIYQTVVPLDKGKVRNTAGTEQYIGGSIGWLKDNVSNRLFLSVNHAKSGFFANASGMAPLSADVTVHDKSNRDIRFPNQEVRHIKVINRNIVYFAQGELETELAYQQNLREEYFYYVQHDGEPSIFPDTLSFNEMLEKQFDKQAYTANLTWTYEGLETLTINSGISTEFQNNSINGRSFLIPAFTYLKAGVFVVATYPINEYNSINGGIRYDYGQLHSKAYRDWYPPYKSRAIDMEKTFQNMSWAIGYNHFKEHFHTKVNLGKSFRMPQAQELASSGFNYHMFREEYGNSQLQPETAYQLDLSAEWHFNRFAIGASPFVSYFPNYIYLNPSNVTDTTTSVLQPFYYEQSKVFRGGGEIHTHYNLAKNLQAGIIAEYVYAEQLSGPKKGFTLPFSPPLNMVANLKYSPQNTNRWTNNFLSIDLVWVNTQKRLVPPEELTPGYQLINFSSGTTIQLASTRLSINLQIRNVLNTKYYKHTSYYRLIDLPEMGRNFILQISIPFKKQWTNNEN